MLIVELSLIAVFYVLPQFETRNSPSGHWEMETPFRDALWLPVVLIAFFSVFALGNIGLLITIRRTIKDLTLKD
jgi:hypothetical protein